MPVIILGILVLLGFVGGYFLSVPVLAAITVVSMIIGEYMARNNHELEVIFTAIYGICATVLNIVLWITYYVTTKQTWLGDFFHQHALR